MNKKRRRLKLDRATIRGLTPAATQEAAGGTAGLSRITLCYTCPCGTGDCTMDYGYTCYSCNYTYCNVACSMDACS